MKFEIVSKLSDEKFRRITGVKRQTFIKMTEIVCSVEALTGRPYKLSIEDRILMTLEYLREYRTYAHIAASYDISETRAFENIRRIEDILIKSKEFALPGKKALLKGNIEYEIVLIDASESPIERPKKNNDYFIPARKKDIQLKRKS